MSEFENEHMLLHFFEILTSEDYEPLMEFNIYINNNIIEVDHSMLKFTISYFKLKKLYLLESDDLLNKILNKINSEYYIFDKNDLKDLFYEIYINYKILKEYQKMKNKIVWVNKE